MTTPLVQVRQAVFLASLFFLGIQPVFAADTLNTGATYYASFADVAHRVRPSVVSISISSSRNREISWAGLRRGPSALRYGSGFVLDIEGHILTNNHVVNGAVGIQVAFSDGSEYAAEIVGQDPETDLALIRLRSNHPVTANRVAHLGTSDSVQVGDWVMAVGSPFGFHHTVSVGVISAKGRHLDRIEGDIPAPPYQSFLQTDASINPGNSGGPLVDRAGRVVGVNTAYNPIGSGIGFAIPINLAAKVAAELLQHGEVIRGYLGIYPQDLTPDLAIALALSSPQGVLVGETQPDSPAERGGLKRGDIILKLGEHPVSDAGCFLNEVAGHQPGESIALSILRDGSPLVLSITLGRRHSQNRPAPGFLPDEAEWPGLEVKNRWDWESSRLRVSKTGPGVVVNYVAPGGPAEKEEIERGDVILEIEGVAIWNIRDYRKMIEKVQDHAKPILFLILKKDEGHTRFVALRPER